MIPKFHRKILFKKAKTNHTIFFQFRKKSASLSQNHYKYLVLLE